MMEHKSAEAGVRTGLADGPHGAFMKFDPGKMEESPQFPLSFPQKMPRANTTSTLMVNSTLERPNMDEVTLSASLVLHALIVDGATMKAPMEEYVLPLKLFDQATYLGNGSSGPGHDEGKIRTLDEPPTVAVMFKYLKKIVEMASFNPESLVTALVYTNRLMMNTKATLHAQNWRLVSLMSLLLAQKMWDDVPLINVDFAVLWDEAAPEAKNVAQLNIKQINKMESTFLSLLKYNLHVSASLYARYYFELRSLAGKETIFNMQPLTKEQARGLETRSAYQQSQVKDEDMRRTWTMMPDIGNAKSGRAIIS